MTVLEQTEVDPVQHCWHVLASFFVNVVVAVILCILVDVVVGCYHCCFLSSGARWLPFFPPLAFPFDCTRPGDLRANLPHLDALAQVPLVVL